MDKCGSVWISMELCGLVWNCAEKFRLCQNDINAPFCWRFEAVLTYSTIFVLICAFVILCDS